MLAGAERHSAVAADTPSIVRRAASAAGPISAAAAQFLLSLVLLGRLDVAEFGRFSFLIVVSQFSVGLWSALFAAPLLVSVAQRRTDGDCADAAAIAGAAFLAQAPAGIAFFIVGLAVGVGPVTAATYAGFGMLFLTRQFGRAWELAHQGSLRVVVSDLVYGAVLIGGAGVLAARAAVSLQAAVSSILAATVAALFPLTGLLGLVLRPGQGLVRRGGYGQIWRRDSRWSLAGVLTTELTVNCHSYLVVGLRGAAAFAPIAATALLIRPITVGINALVEFERARFARLLAQGRLTEVNAGRRSLHLLLLGLWAATALLAMALVTSAPRLVFHGKFTGETMAVGTALWLAVGLARGLHSPEGAILQAAGRFRYLSAISAVTCVISLVFVTGLIFAVGPLWSIAGVAIGEGVFAIALWRACTRFRSYSARAVKDLA
jgi:hypothetical protein